MVDSLRMRMKLDLRLSSHREYLSPKRSERYVADFFRREVKPSQICFDVGAFVGYYSLLLGKLVGHQGRVIAFEPVPECARRIIENAKLNGLDNVRVEALAVAARAESGTLKVSRDPWSGGVLTTSSLSRSTTGEQLSVQITSIDDYVDRSVLGRLDMVKIDVEGAELDVLEGMSQTLDRFQPVILLELNEMGSLVDVNRLLGSHGYSVTSLGSSRNLYHFVCRRE